MKKYHFSSQTKKQAVLVLEYGSFLFYSFRLFLLETVATSTAFRIAGAGVTYVDTGKGTIIARTVEFTFRYVTTDAGVHFFFIHHNFTLLLVKTVCASFLYFIDFFLILLYNNIIQQNSRRLYYESYFKSRRKRYG